MRKYLRTTIVSVGVISLFGLTAPVAEAACPPGPAELKPIKVRPGCGYAYFKSRKMQTGCLTPVRKPVKVGGGVSTPVRKPILRPVQAGATPGGESVGFWKFMTPGKPVTLRLFGGGQSNLDLLVFDSRGNLVASDMRPTDRGEMCFLPKVPGYYRVVIQNKGVVPNLFVVTTDRSRAVKRPMIWL